MKALEFEFEMETIIRAPEVCHVSSASQETFEPRKPLNFDENVTYRVKTPRRLSKCSIVTPFAQPASGSLCFQTGNETI